MLKRWISGFQVSIMTWVSLCLALCPVPVVVAGIDGDEYLLKSAFIYNFIKFTHWPREVDQAGGLNLCTVGMDELVGSLQRLRRETVRGRPIRIKTFDPSDADNACDVLYVAASEQHRFTRFVESTLGRPVLTISQIRGFADAGGVIQLYRAATRVRFKINLGAARSRGLHLSARLLDLAELVDRRMTP